MIKYKLKNIYKILLTICFLLLLANKSFAAKYTICKGKEFNNRIKMSIDQNFNSTTPEYSILGFDYSPYVKGKAIDISEDGDQSVLAYIDNNILYYVSDEDVYLNSDCSYMFDRFISIKNINLSNFNFKKIKNANFMFSNCKYLNNLDMDNDTEIKLNEMVGMFFDCESLKDLNLTMLNTKNVKSFNSLFYNCKNLQNILINPSIFKTNNVTNYNKMYYNCLSLKTNYNLKVTDIKEEKYNVFTRPGTEFLEGLLRDYDYDYDELVLDNKNYKVDDSKNNLILSDDNLNKDLNKDELEKSKSFINIDISPDSNYYNAKSDDRINIDGKMDTSKYVSNNTLKDVPILIDETTFVDKLVPKNKSTKSDIIDEENYEGRIISSYSSISYDDVKGVLRPNYSNINLEDTESLETIAIDESIVDFDINEINKFDISIYYPFIIFILVIIFIVTGMLISKYINKDEDL